MQNNYQYPKTIVGAFIFNDNNELFLMRSPKWQKKFICPGGGVEFTETLQEALVREVKEETNMKIEDIKFITVLEDTKLTDKEYSKPNKHLVYHNYFAKLKTQTDIILNDEATDYKWMKVEAWLKRKDLQKTVRLTLEKHLLENEDFEAKYKRALADYQNLLKRSATEKEEFAKYANERIITEILPVYDNLRTSMKFTDQTAEDNGWATGIKYVIKQFKDVLDSFGIEEIDTKGKKFDPNTMEALEGTGEKVKEEVKPGYKLKGKLIMPAKVKVG